MSMTWKTVPGAPTIELQLQLTDTLRASSSWAWRYPGFLVNPAAGWTLAFEVTSDPRAGRVTLVLWPEPQPEELPF